MNHLTWETVRASVGPHTTYGVWEGAKCFSIFWAELPKHVAMKYRLKSSLPGFRKDLPQFNTEDEAKAFAEKMLTRWVAKRGLLFKGHIIVTDAMVEAADNAAPWSNNNPPPIDSDALRSMIKAALEARG